VAEPSDLDHGFLRFFSSVVMRGLDPRIHLLAKRWIAGTSPAMTPGAYRVR
jgi:hypothetical protein